MHDYTTMPKLEWHDDKATLAKIKTQVMREEPVILIMPENFNFEVDAQACGCHSESDLLIKCSPKISLSALAKQNAIPELEEIGTTAYDAGLLLDIDAAEGHLILHDL